MIELKGPDAHEWAAHRCTRQVVADLAADLDRALLALVSAGHQSTDPKVTAAAMRYSYTKQMLAALEPKPGGEDDSD